MHSFFNAQNVSKEFDKFRLGPISFEVPQGSIVGVIGKNGCGKSTLLETLMGITQASSADAHVEVNGICLQEDEKNYKKKIAYVFNELPFNDGMSAVTIGKYYGRYYEGFSQQKYEDLLEKFDIVESLGAHISMEQSKKNICNVDKLSKGQQIKVQLAFAQSYDADVYFLDEPTGNLDAKFRDELYDTIRRSVMDEDKCIIYASHLVEEMENFVDYILWLRKEGNIGSEYFFGTVDELRDSYRMVSGEKELLDRIPEAFIVGGRISHNSKELLIRYDKAAEAEWLGEEIRKNMRYADLKEIMYYVEKEGVVYRD